MQKSKQQLKDESIDRFNIQVIAAKKDIKCLEDKLFQIDTTGINEIATEATNVIMGIRRDILICIDNLKRINRLLTKGEANDKN